MPELRFGSPERWYWQGTKKYDESLRLGHLSIYYSEAERLCNEYTLFPAWNFSPGYPEDLGSHRSLTGDKVGATSVVEVDEVEDEDGATESKKRTKSK